MLIMEVAAPSGDIAKLEAISQFLIGRGQDTGADKMSVATDTFIKLAAGQGISLTVDRLKELSQQPPLSNLIVNVEGDERNGKIIFKGAESAITDVMTPDQAQDTVDTMAKRAAKKGL